MAKTLLNEGEVRVERCPDVMGIGSDLLGNFSSRLTQASVRGHGNASTLGCYQKAHESTENEGG